MSSTQIEGRWFRALALLMALAAGGSTLSCAGEADDGEPSDGALLVVLHPHDGPTVTYGGGLYLQLLDVQAPEGAAVDLTASVEPSMSASIEPSSLVGGGVAELLMRPTQDRAEQTATFEVRAVSGARHASASGTFDIITWEDDGPEYADSLLAIFLPYIATHYPELGLSPSIEWLESWNSQPVLVVTHRSYLSADWELHVAWHNTIPPHDWAFLTVRRRTQLNPEKAFCFPSQMRDHTVQLADLADPRLPCAR